MEPKDLANRIFVTCYMGSENSSEDTRSRATGLAHDVGSYHMGEINVLKKHCQTIGGLLFKLQHVNKLLEQFVASLLSSTNL